MRLAGFLSSVDDHPPLIPESIIFRNVKVCPRGVVSGKDRREEFSHMGRGGAVSW